MKIIVTSEKQSITLFVPTGLLVNRFCYSLLRRRHAKKLPKISWHSFRKIRKALRDAKRSHVDWYILDAVDSDKKSRVRIKI